MKSASLQGCRGPCASFLIRATRSIFFPEKKTRLHCFQKVRFSEFMVKIEQQCLNISILKLDFMA